jgi:membrane protein implicated in regulation of membrane protease activity
VFTLFNLLLVLGVVLIVAEIFVPGFVLLPIGAGLLTAAFWTYVFEWTGVVIGMAAIHSAIFFVISHRFLRKASSTSIRTNTDHMIGQHVLVTEAIYPPRVGYIKLYGDLWPAVGLNHDAIEVGEEVVIQGLSGNKVIVARPSHP